MPSIVIVYVPDDHTADGVVRLAQMTGELAGNGRVIGVYDFPRRSELECRGFCISKRGAGWGRHRKGFMVCSVCNGRHVHARRRVFGSLFDNLGANRLRRDATPAAFRNPEGYGDG